MGLLDYTEPWPGVELPARWRGLEAGLTYDEAAAEQAVRFFLRHVRHVKGEWAGRAFDLAPWQARRIIRPMFGLKGPDGLRAIRRTFVEVPRKNGKSLLGSGVALKLLFADQEPGAEVYSAAVDKGQASIVYDVGAACCELSPGLSARARIYRGNQKRIVATRTGGFYTVVSADGKRAHGFNSHGLILDELHAWPGDYSGSLLEALSTSTGSRRQPLIFIITTAGFDRESICFREYVRACQIRDGILLAPNYLPVIYEVPRDVDWKDPDVWHEANPNLGVSKKLDYMAEQANRAAQAPADLNAFLRLDLDIWTEQKTRWIPPAAWAACAVPGLTFPDGATITAAVDLSTRTDTTAVSIAWDLPDGRIGVKAHVFIPEETATKRESEEHIPYRHFAGLGLCTLTPGNVVDYSAVVAYVQQLGQRANIRQIGFDPWNGEMFRQELDALGFPTVEFRQGFRTMGEPTYQFQTAWRSRRLAHDGDELMAWQASNCAVLEDPAGNMKPAKNLSGDRIDAIVAAIMAVWLLIGAERELDAGDVLD